MEGLSHRIVNFIGGLYPLYMHDQVNGVQCARSLVDGTLILPMGEAEDQDEELVTVHWQGDPSRRTVVQGVFMASIAVARYVELHHMAEKAKDTKDEMEGLAHHFEVKTGASLVFDIQDDSELFSLVGKAASRLGKEAVIEIMKKSMGL